jgi:hypothetical protein
MLSVWASRVSVRVKSASAPSRQHEAWSGPRGAPGSRVPSVLEGVARAADSRLSARTNIDFRLCVSWRCTEPLGDSFSAAAKRTCLTVESEGMHSMRVCVVGASGKLGQYVVQHALNRGYEVVGVCRKRVSAREGLRPARASRSVRRPRRSGRGLPARFRQRHTLDRRARQRPRGR